MNLENANRISLLVEEDNFLQNLKAQAKAKHILLNVNEPIENYPKFTDHLEQRLSSLAFTHLSIGCTLFENQLRFDSYDHFEKAGEIINNIFTHQIELTNSKYYLLVSSLSLYIATQYSKSYLVIKEIEYSSPITKLISQFLRKDFTNLSISLDDVLLNSEYSDSAITDFANDKDANASIYSVLIAKTIACVLEYFHEGDIEWISRAKQILTDLKELSEFDEEPSIWWITRLLIIIIDT